MIAIFQMQNFLTDFAFTMPYHYRLVLQQDIAPLRGGDNVQSSTDCLTVHTLIKLHHSSHDTVTVHKLYVSVSCNFITIYSQQ